MKAIFCKGFNAHYNNAILNVAINSKLNSADLHLTNGGGGAKSRLCATHYPLNPNLSLYTLFFAFYFFVIASECIARARHSIKSKMLCQIDCHAKNRLCSFLLAMTGKTANTLPCHTETLCRSIHRKITLLNSIYGYFANAQYDKFRQKPKFDSLPRFDFVKASNDGKMASFGVDFMNFYVNFGEKFKENKENNEIKKCKLRIKNLKKRKV